MYKISKEKYVACRKMKLVKVSFTKTMILRISFSFRDNRIFTKVFSSNITLIQKCRRKNKQKFVTHEIEMLSSFFLFIILLLRYYGILLILRYYTPIVKVFSICQINFLFILLKNIVCLFSIIFSYFNLELGSFILSTIADVLLLISAKCFF